MDFLHKMVVEVNRLVARVGQRFLSAPANDIAHAYVGLLVAYYTGKK